MTGISAPLTSLALRTTNQRKPSYCPRLSGVYALSAFMMRFAMFVEAQTAMRSPPLYTVFSTTENFESGRLGVLDEADESFSILINLLRGIMDPGSVYRLVMHAGADRLNVFSLADDAWAVSVAQVTAVVKGNAPHFRLGFEGVMFDDVSLVEEMSFERIHACPDMSRFPSKVFLAPRRVRFLCRMRGVWRQRRRFGVKAEHLELVPGHRDKGMLVNA
jgi:hypothetical protein